MRGAIVLLMSAILAPRPMAELVCDAYTYLGPTTIVCHGEGLPDIVLDDAFMGWDEDPDYPDDWYLFVAGYPR